MKVATALKYACLLGCLAFVLSGCTATYVPISWGFGEQVHRLSRTDPTLSILYERYDPQRETLRVAGESFDEVMMPSEIQYHLGAYRRDSRLIYRNLYNRYTEHELRDVMLHELSHHIWYNYMDQNQRVKWAEHLERHPSPWQQMVRRVYRNARDYETEDFAFTVACSRPVDLRELSTLGLISSEEAQMLLTDLERQLPLAAARVGGRCLALAPAFADVPLIPSKEYSFDQ